MGGRFLTLLLVLASPYVGADLKVRGYASGAGSVVHAQATDPVTRYTAVVEAYRMGSDRAVADMAGWGQADIDGVLAAVAARGGTFAAAAAMLHTQVAVAAAAADWRRGAIHLSAAAALVQSLRADDPFVERYYAFIPTLFLAHGDVDGARQWVDRGLQVFEFSAPLRTMSGAVEELAAHVADPDGSASLSRPLVTAEREYRLALQRDEAFAEARLRLGRVLAASNRTAEAVTQLTWVTGNGSPRLRYLAHLFLGRMATQAGDLAAARRAFQSAMAALPGYQTPYIALSHLEEGGGDPAKAREFAAEAARMTAPRDPDPWSAYQNGGLDTEAMQWLVAYVRQ